MFNLSCKLPRRLKLYYTIIKATNVAHLQSKVRNAERSETSPKIQAACIAGDFSYRYNDDMGLKNCTIKLPPEEECDATKV